MNNNKSAASSVVTLGLMMALLQGVSNFICRSGLDTITAFEMLSYRFIVATVAIVALSLTGFWQVNWKEYFKKNQKSMILLTVVYIATYGIQVYGMARVSVTFYSILFALVPVLTAITGILMVGDRLSGAQWVSMAVAIAGSLFFVFVGGVDKTQNSVLGMTMVVLSLVGVAVYNVMARKCLNTEYTERELTGVTSAATAVFFTVWAFLPSVLGGTFGADFFGPLKDMKILGIILFLGIANSIVIFLINYKILKLMAAFVQSLFQNLATIVSVSLGVFLRGDTFTLMHAVGAVLIIVGCIGIIRFTPKDQTE